MVRRVIILVALLLATPLWAMSDVELEEQTRVIASELRCVVCQNLSVADSPSEMAQQMRAVVREQLEAGKTPDEVRSYFVSKYGEWVLLAPTPKGFSLLLWVLPFVALLIGLVTAIGLAWRWAARKQKVEGRAVDPALLARVQSEMAAEPVFQAEPDDSDPRSRLLRERARLYADLNEIQFDYHAGKLSQEDFNELRREIQVKAAKLLEESDRIVVSEPASMKASAEKTGPTVPPQPLYRPIRGWKLATGGAFLLIFGITLGIALTNSIRPRLSESDSITGDFLTGTSGRSDVRSSLNEGKIAFAQQDWPKAIEAFKTVLALNPNEPEAHAYMGYILFQAGHADGALMAFDKALDAAPNLPMALWGKGMTLYQAKRDVTGARQTLEKLAALLPPGQERSEVEKALAEISQAGAPAVQSATPPARSQPAGQQISGNIRVDPKLQSKVNKQATLFIIARPADAPGGPPLAVKKIDTPTFPLSYSLGRENVMIQGTPFSGKLLISVRLDRDGNPMTREPGDLFGESKIPVEVGAKDVDIVLDQVAK